MSFKFDLIYKNKNVLGLDIGSTSIKIAELRKKRGLTFLVGCGLKEISQSLLNEKGEIANPEEATKEIKELLGNPKWGKITSKRVSLSISESRIFSRVLDLPDMSGKELKEAVIWEADQYIPISAKDLYIDWEVLLKKQKGKEILNEVMMVAVPKGIIDSYLATIDLLGLEPLNIEMSLQSIARSMISNKQKGEAILIIDIGGDRTSIGVFDDVIRITGSIQIGGGNISPAVGSKAAEFNEIDELVVEIKKLIDYYEGKDEETKKISRALLCGGTASLSGVAEILSKKINMPVEIGNPWANISTYPLKPVPKNESPRYANVIGLALRGVLNE